MPAVPHEERDHGESSSSTLLKERRFKLSRACDRCRRRRIKCDEGHPCQACLTANAACTFEEPGKRTHPHKSKRTVSLEDRMQHLENLIHAIPPAVFAASSSVGDRLEGASSPLAPFVTPSHTFPMGVPPPALHVFPLLNPSTHFPSVASTNTQTQSPNTTFSSLFGSSSSTRETPPAPEAVAEDMTRMSLSASYLYFDDEGYTRWQGETSGLPLLDALVERHPSRTQNRDSSPKVEAPSSQQTNEWFPNRTTRRTDLNPETLWRLITSSIPPELMDSLVQCYLSTSYYILPFLHVPTFLADYGNPKKWGEPGFAAFIVAICCLASRHIDDPRARANPSDGISAGTHWFELLGRLRTLPIADRPTLYTIQADLIAAVYAVGLGKLSKAAALLSEAITVSIDAGLHRSVDTYDLFDPIEDEVRKRTFWCVYIWDKQLCAHFGRPPMIRLRDCDVSEPTPVDDEFITHEGIGSQPQGTESRMSAFICALRIMVVLESVLSVPPSRNVNAESPPFLSRAAALLTGARSYRELREEELLLDDIHSSIPSQWTHSPETLATDDAIRITQAERLYSAEAFVRMLIHRHRFSELALERTMGGGFDDTQSDAEREAMTSAHQCALKIISTHLHIATKGLMTYYGVHVIHQLTQAGRTLIAVLLNYKSEAQQHIITPSLDALRSCVGLLRRFSGRYVCGVRSGELMEEFCRITQIPLDTQTNLGNNSRPPWIRPVPKKSISNAPRSNTSGDSQSRHNSPEPWSPRELFTETDSTSPQSPHGALALGSSIPYLPTMFAPSNSTNTGAASESSLYMEVDNFGSPGMYMSPQELMALFSVPEGTTDISSLYSPSDYNQMQSPLTRGREGYNEDLFKGDSSIVA